MTGSPIELSWTAKKVQCHHICQIICILENGHRRCRTFFSWLFEFEIVEQFDICAPLSTLLSDPFLLPEIERESERSGRLAHRFAIFLCSLDVEIDDRLVGQL